MKPPCHSQHSSTRRMSEKNLLMRLTGMSRYAMLTFARQTPKWSGHFWGSLGYMARVSEMTNVG